MLIPWLPKTHCNSNMFKYAFSASLKHFYAWYKQITGSPEGLQLTDALKYPTFRNAYCSYGKVLENYSVLLINVYLNLTQNKQFVTATAKLWCSYSPPLPLSSKTAPNSDRHQFGTFGRWTSPFSQQFSATKQNIVTEEERNWVLK